MYIHRRKRKLSRREEEEAAERGGKERVGEHSSRPSPAIRKFIREL